MLEFPRCVGLRVDIGNLLELQRALEPERVIQIPADEEHRIVIEILRGEELNLFPVGENCLNFFRQHLELFDQTGIFCRVQLSEFICHVDGQHVDDGQLRGVCLRGRDGNLGASPRIEHVVRLSCDRASNHVHNREHPRASGLCLAQRRHGV